MQKVYNDIGFWEKRKIFFAENGQKSQKIVIITSVPGLRFSGDVAKKVTQLPTQYETWLTKGLPRGEEVCHPQLDSLAERWRAFVSGSMEVRGPDGRTDRRRRRRRSGGLRAVRGVAGAGRGALRQRDHGPRVTVRALLLVAQLVVVGAEAPAAEPAWIGLFTCKKPGSMLWITIS
jgi:hypothetical protein